uniref:Transposase n=1 Tax=Steinernema glaseri TaxID=37863 RepID=A0A1I8AS12_9BILA
MSYCSRRAILTCELSVSLCISAQKVRATWKVIAALVDVTNLTRDRNLEMIAFDRSAKCVHKRAKAALSYVYLMYFPYVYLLRVSCALSPGTEKR